MTEELRLLKIKLASEATVQYGCALINASMIATQIILDHPEAGDKVQEMVSNFAEAASLESVIADIDKIIEAIK